MNEYYKNLPKKRMGAGALFLNDDEEVLIVKPSYKDHWSIPGGTVDDNESPKAACIREIKEEINLDASHVTFLCVDYSPRESDEKNESLRFIFYAGVLTDSEISNIKLDNKELVEFRFAPVSEAEKLLGHKLARRLPKCMDAIKTGTSIYLENGNF
ncbi:NUDIX hydrolase [Patescibacteria group bacterium]|nr:NUDIX hydrolase [Patescibacteria group bacterium]MDE1946731.1 NUDIX hydrolase [Patescibacteria group bacterium]MDE2010966.1 NUDIX hydrolase [Patescibacteria group bacterium]MDE2232809.1 NUDIX hydrolase [Patescibacteria group bacterium]